MAEVQQAELADLEAVIGEALDQVNSYDWHNATPESLSKPVAKAIVEAENIFIGASYVKAEAAEGRTVFCILTSAEANALVVFRQTQQTGELDAGT